MNRAILGIRHLMTSPSMPQTMRAVTYPQGGGPEVLQVQQVPVPTPGPQQLLIKNNYAGINYIDTYFRSGLYDAPLPGRLGREGSGTIAAMGEQVKGFNIGDLVLYLDTKTQAEYCLSEPRMTCTLPKDVDEKTGAALLLQGLTAITLIRESYAARAGDWCFVPAAAGGVGGILTQLLAAIGVNVIATASTEEKRQLALKYGAKVAVDYDHDTIVKTVMDHTQGQGVHCCYDGVGKDTFETDLAILRRKGAYVSFGNASGAVPPFPITRLMSKNICLLRPQLYGYLATREEFEHHLNDLMSFVAKGQVQVPYTVYPLEQVQQAHQDLTGRKTTGKLLLQI